MADKIVECIIAKNGKVTLETKGFKGKACMNLNQALKGVGTDVTTKKTSEYHSRQDANEVNIIGRS